MFQSVEIDATDCFKNEALVKIHFSTKSKRAVNSIMLTKYRNVLCANKSTIIKYTEINCLNILFGSVFYIKLHQLIHIYIIFV